MGLGIKMKIKEILGLSPKKESEGYWDSRSHMNYYSTVREWIEELSPGEIILDVGGKDTPVVTWGNFKRRYLLDRMPQVKAYPGVEHLRIARCQVFTCYMINNI
jgi:hypothetical protein